MGSLIKTHFCGSEAGARKSQAPGRLGERLLFRGAQYFGVRAWNCFKSPFWLGEFLGGL